MHYCKLHSRLWQVDIQPEQMHTNVQATAALHGDVDSIVTQVSSITVYSLPNNLISKISVCIQFKRNILL